jgi:hypothetical protein
LIERKAVDLLVFRDENIGKAVGIANLRQRNTGVDRVAIENLFGDAAIERCRRLVVKALQENFETHDVRHRNMGQSTKLYRIGGESKMPIFDKDG